MATAVLVAAVLVLPLGATTPQVHRGAGSEAEWLVRQFETTEWRADYLAWRKKHVTTGCREFHGDGSSLFIADLWSYRCFSVSGSARVNRFFYILNSTNPPESRLDQFLGEIWESPDVPISAVQRMHNRIQSLLMRQYGQPDAPDTTPAGVAAWGSGDWRMVRVWHLPDRDVYLYIRETPGQRAAVGLLARDHALEVASREEGRELLLAQQPSTVVEDQIDSRLAAALAKDFPTASELLGDSDTQPSSEAVYDAAAEMAHVAVSATPDLRPMLLLAADRLVSRWRLPERQKLSSGTEGRMKQLAATAGVHFAWNPQDDSWSYQHDLLWSVWRAAPESEWGQDAFFLLLASGWDTSGVCHNGAEQFHTVIEQGQKFLASNPSSPLRLPVTYLMAEAFETWWSLSEWSACSPVIDLGSAPCRAALASARYQSGAEAARAQAIADYEAVLAADPSTYGTPALRRRLARLKLGIDTNQRQFYCLNG